MQRKNIKQIKILKMFNLRLRSKDSIMCDNIVIVGDCSRGIEEKHKKDTLGQGVMTNLALEYNNFGQ